VEFENENTQKQQTKITRPI